jgi:hypothetical protein
MRPVYRRIPALNASRTPETAFVTALLPFSPDIEMFGTSMIVRMLCKKDCSHVVVENWQRVAGSQAKA